MDMKPDVELHVDELLLRGFAPADGERIAAALRRQLATLLAESGIDSASERQIDRVDAGPLRVGPGASPAAIGRATAAAIHGALKGGRRAC
jgi:hypothetical protein